jgi:hypothetical protein
MARRFAIQQGIEVPKVANAQAHEFGWAEVPDGASFLVDNDYWNERGAVYKDKDGKEVNVSSNATQMKSRIRTNFDNWRTSKGFEKTRQLITRDERDKDGKLLGVRCWVVYTTPAKKAPAKKAAPKKKSAPATNTSAEAPATA